MLSRQHDRDRPRIRTKGKRAAAKIWPPPAELHFVTPDKSTGRPNLSRATFAQPHSTRSASQTSSILPLPQGKPPNEKHSSNTWTSSSENPDLPSEEETDNRELFVLEYNRLALQYGIRPLVPDDFPYTTVHPNDTLESRRDSWFSKMLRHASGQSEQTASKSDKSPLCRQRSLSDAASNFIHNHKRDGLKNQDLKTLVRLCGRSSFFLPTDYAPCSLTLPTCFRALAQSLVQHADTKGIFRVPGSVRVVNALYDYYCTDSNTDGVSSTTRCPTLPKHIRCNTHDVASTFKRFLVGLPGGVLGCLSLFDALVAIHSQLQSDPELHWTKESKLRARLIAFAIGAVKSRYQRELICAVFGLLSLVGRFAENAPREDERGRPLPTVDLMGYNALGAVFGPLLVGDLINNYSMRVADPSAGLVLLPISPPRSRKERRKLIQKYKHTHTKERSASVTSSFTVDKIHIANDIAEMLIIHWREVVRQIRNIGAIKPRPDVSSLQYRANAPNDSSSVSENVSLGGSTGWDRSHRISASPSLVCPVTTQRMKSSGAMSIHDSALNQKANQATRSRLSRSRSMRKQLTKAAPHFLSPTVEESPSPCVKASKFHHEKKEGINNLLGDLAKDVHPFAPNACVDTVHKNSLQESFSRSEVVTGQPIAEMDTFVPCSHRSTFTLKDETPLLPLLQRSRTLDTPSSETALTDSSQTSDPITARAALSSDIQVQPFVDLDQPAAQASPRHKGDTAKLGYRNSQQFCYDNGATTFQLELNHAHLPDTKSGRLEFDKRMAIWGKDTASPRKSTIDSNLSEGDRSTPTAPLDEGRALPRKQDKGKVGSEISGSPEDQWRYIVAMSRASAESLAKSAKEKRRKRRSGHVFSRPSQEAILMADKKPTTLEKKRQLIPKSELETKATVVSPEKKNIFEESTHLARSTPKTTPNGAQRPSRAKYSTNPPDVGRSLRSTSKPMPGAVKAMAALFDKGIRDSPFRPPAILNGRSRKTLRESYNFPRHDDGDVSPTKSSTSRDSLGPANSWGKSNGRAQRSHLSQFSTPQNDFLTLKGRNVGQTASVRKPVDHTPTDLLRDTLRPVKMFMAARKDPQVSPSDPIQRTERNQPPRLGTIVPHQDEPPIGHFIRPRWATSVGSQNVSLDGIHPLDRLNSRHVSGNSSLYAQIRSLQRQLDIRNEEILQLRRQLETQENMDIGTLSEQLRAAKRECMSWRKRAEAAERRIAVFQRSASKFQTLEYDEIDEAKEIACETMLEDGCSSYSVHVEDQEALNNRFRTSIMGKTGTGGGDGAVFEDDIGEMSDIGASMEYQRCRDRSRRTVQLWKAAQKELDLQDDNKSSL